MKKKRRKTENTGSELFLLAMVQRGQLSSLYNLQQATGLSAGALVAPLGRLLDEGLLRKSKAVERGRQELRITSAGEEKLRQHWREALREIPASGEAVLRNAWVGVMFGKSDALGFLRAASLARKTGAEDRLREARRLRDAVESPVDAYRWARIHLDAARLAAEAVVFQEVAELLESKEVLKTAPHGAHGAD